VSRAGISDPRPGGDGTLLGEPVLVFRPGYGIFDQDGNKLGTAHRIHDKYPHYELRDTEVRCVVRNTMRNRNRHGSVWEYVVCTPDGEEVARLSRPRGWSRAEHCTVARGTETIATLDKRFGEPLNTRLGRLIRLPAERWQLTDNSGRDVARITVAWEHAVYVLEVETWVVEPMRTVALASCVVAHEEMANLGGGGGG
jgi:hypothetical protein